MDNTENNNENLIMKGCVLMNNDYTNIDSISAIADAIDGVTYFVGRMVKTGMGNLRRKK